MKPSKLKQVRIHLSPCPIMLKDILQHVLHSLLTLHCVPARPLTHGRHVWQSISIGLRRPVKVS